MVKASIGGEGQFFYSHLQWRGILKPSSAPLGIIQNTYLDDTHKGREAFSEVKESYQTEALVGYEHAHGDRHPHHQQPERQIGHALRPVGEPARAQRPERR